MKRVFTLSAFILVFIIPHPEQMEAQGIGISADESTPDSSAILDIQSNTKGVLVPRMTTAQREFIITPATGLLVYDTNTNGFWYYDGTGWSNLTSTVASGWLLTGNTGMDPDSNFIGTTDDMPLLFRANDIRAGEFNTTSKNYFIG
ncbi:MAG: hypothetical protein KBA14_05670, partial [Saprospiraceae bacterium]|nr:hypothetical protein [Saprospiraceae bacterium]